MNARLVFAFSTLVACAPLVTTAPPRVQTTSQDVAVRVAAAEGERPPAPGGYTIADAVSDALANHPRLAAAHAEQAAADARVGAARLVVLPSAGVSAELNRSTGNIAPGAFFPTEGFPVISGPTRNKTLDDGFWQSGVSVWARWNAMSIVRQAASVDVALAGRREATAIVRAEELEIAYRACDAFVALLEAQETVSAARANVDRATVLVATTKTLVDQKLRPGADLARAEAELADARTLVAGAEQTRDVRRAELATAVGRARLDGDVATDGLLAPVDAVSATRAGDVADHPRVLAADAAAARAREASRLVKVDYLPRVDLVAALWARGSGLYDSPADGVVPDVPNWAAGAVITWSILDVPSIAAHARAADAEAAAAVARRDEVALEVSGELASASAMLEGALRVARQTPEALAAARAAQEQALTRYKTGLAAVLDVADAERILARAEMNDAVARLEVRRALLLLARAGGDLGPFLSRVGAHGGR